MKLTLKAIRINKNLSQKEAAKQIGVSVDTLGKYERGLTFPDITILKKIEEVYDIQYDNINFFSKKLRPKR